jgi:hypothetical protein
MSRDEPRREDAQTFWYANQYFGTGFFVKQLESERVLRTT